MIKNIKGVNLGGWLVLEKWMTPELYQDYKAEDEYNEWKGVTGPGKQLREMIAEERI